MSAQNSSGRAHAKIELDRTVCRTRGRGRTHSHVDIFTYLARSAQGIIFHAPLYSLHPQPELLCPENVPVSQSQRHVQPPAPGPSATASKKAGHKVRRIKAKAAADRRAKCKVGHKRATLVLAAGEVIRIHQRGHYASLTPLLDCCCVFRERRRHGMVEKLSELLVVPLVTRPPLPES